MKMEHVSLVYLRYYRTQADGLVVHAARLIGRSYQGVTWLIENKYYRFAQEADAGSTPDDSETKRVGQMTVTS